MELDTTGQLIRNMREKMNIARQELSEGLCPSSLLEKIEEDLIEPDTMLAKILMERLGISSDKIEYILSVQDYKWLEAYDQFYELVFCGRGDWASWLLPRLRNTLVKSPVQEMLFHRCHALYQYYIAKDKNRSAGELANALRQASPCLFTTGLPVDKWLEQASARNKSLTNKVFSGKTSSNKPLLALLNITSQKKKPHCLLSSMEIENLLAFVRILSEIKKISTEDAIDVLSWCKGYIDRQVTDPEAHAQVACKCAWLLAGFYIFQKNETKAFELCDSAFEELQDYGISYFMRPLLQRMLKCCSVYALSRKREKYERYLGALTRIYTAFGEPWYPQDSILYHCCQHEYFLDDEVLRGGRLTLGLTQAQMIEGIFHSERSLSQIENRKSKPTKANFRKLLGNLNLQKTRFNGLVLTDSAEMLEKAQELRRLISKEKHVEMERHIRELQKGLDMSLFENQRTIRYFENVIDYTNKSRKYEDVLREDYQLLRRTYDIKRELYRTPFRLEEEYINQIAIMLRKTGREKDAIALYQKVLETYDKSRVKKKYHFRCYNTMLGNLAARQESPELSREAIRLSLKCGKLHALHFNCMTYLCALELTENVDKEYCRTLLEDIISLCSLVKNDKNLIKARQYYEENYC